MMLMVLDQRYSLFSLMLTMTFSFGCIGDVTGQRFDEENQCWAGEKEFSYSGNKGCDTAFTYGRDAKGTIWKFKDSCIGDDLVLVNFSDNFIECPTSGGPSLQPTFAQVDQNRMCLRPSSPCGFFVAVDDPCWETEPVVMYENRLYYSENECCGFEHSSTEITPEMAKDLEPCPELLE